MIKKLAALALVFALAVTLFTTSYRQNAGAKHTSSRGSRVSSSETSSQSSSTVSSEASSAVSSEASSQAQPSQDKSSADGGTAAAQGESWPAGGAVPSPVSVPNLDGTTVFQNGSAYIDLSYLSYGFVKIHLLQASDARVKVMIIKDNNNNMRYTYDLNQGGATEIYPLQRGSGSYSVSVLKNVGGDNYSYLASTNIGVSLSRSDISFLVPSQIVNYTQGSSAASIARSLVSGKSNNFERISAICSYVAQNIHYNYGLASSVSKGYVPNVDSALANGSGICYDYAAVTAAMLRSIGYPTKLIMGNSGNVYHAWNEVYVSGSGWIKVMSVKVNMNEWSLVDTTFISTAQSPASIEQYVNNSGNYQTTKVY